ncbi:MAG: hypothetical protein H5T85_01135 [Actinobacteria bacterium]|nr:hypothetical protein [Actinomycetota bacterium]
MIQRQDIINFLQYLGAAGTLIFSLLSLFVTNQRKKLVFFACFILFSSFLGLLFYSGVTLFVTGLPGLMVLLFIFILQESEQRSKVLMVKEKSREKDKENADRINRNNHHISQALRVITGVILCIIASYFFYESTFDFFARYEKVSTISIASTSSVMSELYTSYLPVVVVLALALFSSALWIVLFLETIKKRDTRRD